MSWLDAIIESMDMSLSKLRETVKDRKAWHAVIYAKSQIGLSAEQQQQLYNMGNICCSVATPWAAVRQDSPSFTISWSLLKLVSVELVMPSSHLIFCTY